MTGNNVIGTILTVTKRSKKGRMKKGMKRIKGSKAPGTENETKNEERNQQSKKRERKEQRMINRKINK